MLSYAQNLEDVVLSRLIGVVPAGTYVDVGAGHPVLDNVTYALYLAGWRGINVEPMPREAQLLREQRPQDRTVEAACGSAAGTVTLFEAPTENRGATTSDADLVASYTASGQTFSAFDAEVVTLASLLADFESGSVHVVKIDVEGMERDVIAGADLAQTRPWVLVIEATTPNTSRDSSAAWEPDVTEAGYSLALFDGLNRFYVRNDLPAVKDLLSTPANVFDGWRRASDALVQDELARAVAEVNRLHDEVTRLHAEASRRESALVDLHAELARLHREVDELHREIDELHRNAAAMIAALERRSRIAEEYARSLEKERERHRHA